LLREPPPLPALLPARLLRDAEGTPVSELYGDIYHSASGGEAQARHVFLAGNGLPQRWQDRRQFTILETGFGLGLNFLVTYAAWQADPQRCATLHFISLEKHPFTVGDLALAHAAWPQFAEFTAELQRQWPPLVAGEHRLELAAGRIVLRLIFGDAADCLPGLRAGATATTTAIDAFYLDGFSPARNPELWSPALCLDLARLAAADARIATWSVAGSVRRALAEAGFVVRKAPGFGSKRQMLCGHYSRGNIMAADSTAASTP